jgi:Xaa-Pro aminopeptidase
MKLFNSEIYINRRAVLKQKLGKGQLLFWGNDEAPMNYKDNHFRYRQDSTFLYYFGLNMPGLAALIDIDTNTEIIFGNEFSLDDTIWMGAQESIQSLAEKVGVSQVLPLKTLKSKVGILLRLLPVYRAQTAIKRSQVLGMAINDESFDEEFVKTVVAQRSIKSPEEIVEMITAVNISGHMHKAAKEAVKEGKTEFQIAAELLHKMKEHNAELSYPVICTVNGQYLHNHYYGNILKNGKMLLIDSGAEGEMGYAGDITRTWPVSGTMNAQQKEIFDTVFEMETSVIAQLKPGIRYAEYHKMANKILLTNLKNIGLLTGDVEDMLTQGVGGLFMPHGLGHMIGLDVHDMEDLGEKYVGYEADQVRSTQLGLKSLRLARTLEAGMVLTVEPGIYFIPALIKEYKAKGLFKEFVNYQKLEAYYDFGGIRIEDNILIEKGGAQVLGDAIPKF